MQSYQRLGLIEREEISRGLYKGDSLEQIAARLGRNKSSLSREISRNVGDREKYRAADGQARAIAKRITRKRKLETHPKLREYVFAKMALRWSPEQIAQALQKEYPRDKTMQISHEAIYSYLYVLPRGELKKTLVGYLRQERPARHKRTGLKEKRGKIPEMISIEERPAEVADRSVPGHWEGDLILGKGHQSALGTLVERTTRWVFLVPLKAKDAKSVRKAFAKAIMRMPKFLRKSMTYDQGKEMAEHRLFTKGTKMKVYFAHPGSPWERGTNENTNGLIRQFFPKGTDFNKVSVSEIRWAEKLLNGRPRKTLDFEKPEEVIGALLR